MVGTQGVILGNRMPSCPTPTGSGSAVSAFYRWCVREQRIDRTDWLPAAEARGGSWWAAGVSLRDIQDFARHADPKTTRRYDCSRHSLNRHATYAINHDLAGGTWLASNASSASLTASAGPSCATRVESVMPR